MLKLADVLKSIASQSGVSETEIKTILDNPALASIEVDDVVSTKLTAPRLSMDAAKNNPDLKKHFTALALNGVDAGLERLATEHGLSAEDITELKALDNTSKRMDSLTSKIKTLEAAKSTKGADTDKLNKTIEELNGQIVKVREEKIAELKAKDDGLENERTDWTSNNVLSNFEYAMQVDKEINVLTTKALVNKELQKLGLNVKRENDDLVLKTSEGTDYFDTTNKKVSYQDFATKVAANNKLLKASNSTPPAKGTPIPRTTTSNNNTFDNADSVIAELESKS